LPRSRADFRSLDPAMTIPLPDRSGIATEKRNPRSMNLHRLSISECVTLINEEDRSVPLALERARPSLVSLIGDIEPRFGAGGRLIYLGAEHRGDLAFSMPPKRPQHFRLSPGASSASSLAVIQRSASRARAKKTTRMGRLRTWRLLLLPQRHAAWHCRGRHYPVCLRRPRAGQAHVGTSRRWPFGLAPHGTPCVLADAKAAARRSPHHPGYRP
jgi:hypothetical protein